MLSEQLFDILFDKRLKEHAQATREQLMRFIQQPKRIKTDQIVSFTKWHNSSLSPYSSMRSLFLEEQEDLQDGGYYICLQGKGIVVNPGTDFFKTFCEKGYSLQDIDIVIATCDCPSIQNALFELQTLNARGNQKLVSYSEAPHLIRFFLHPKQYGRLVGQFRPTFREERSSLISLETFSHKEEVYQLVQELELAYMTTESGALALRLDAEERSIGFITRGGYLPAMEQFFMPCQVLIGGIGTNSIEDFEKVAFMKASLGFYGLWQLIERAENLELVLVSEFSRAMGDLRIELLRKLQKGLEKAPLILPMDSTFAVDLQEQTAVCENGTHCLLGQLRVIRSDGSFGKLQYVANEDLL